MYIYNRVQIVYERVSIKLYCLWYIQGVNISSLTNWRKEILPKGADFEQQGAG